MNNTQIELTIQESHTLLIGRSRSTSLNLLITTHREEIFPPYGLPIVKVDINFDMKFQNIHTFYRHVSIIL